MTRTRQQFLALLAALALIQGAVALAVSLPLLLDAALEAVHALLGLCHHRFRAHYANLLTPVALTLTSAVAVLAGRFCLALFRSVRRTSRVVGALLDGPRTVPPVGVQAVQRRLGLGGRVDLVEHAAPVAFCHGFLRPRICLSTALCARLDEGSLAVVLLHEDHHRRRREPLRLALLGALVRALPPPFQGRLTSLAAEARAEMEVAADAAVLRRGGSAPALARTMLAFLDQPAAFPEATAAGLAVCQFSPTEARIECLTRAVTRPYPPLAWRSFGALGLALAVPLAAFMLLGMESDLHPILHACL